jgi:hypothetical protein
MSTKYVNPPKNQSIAFLLPKLSSHYSLGYHPILLKSQNFQKKTHLKNYSIATQTKTNYIVPKILAKYSSCFFLKSPKLPHPNAFSHTHSTPF